MKIFGFILLIAGPVLLLFALAGYAISSYTVSQIIAAHPASPAASVEGMTTASLVGNIMNLVFGALGILGIISVPIGAVLLALGIAKEEKTEKIKPKAS